jgi:hypothetical protein
VAATADPPAVAAPAVAVAPRQVTWITAAEVAAFLDPPPSSPADVAWLDEVVAAANGYAFGRRAAYGYVDEQTQVPSDAVHTGTVPSRPRFLPVP